MLTIFPKSRYFFLLNLFFIGNTAFAQQWVDKKYNYDSSLNVVYGAAVNFNGGIDTLRMDIYTPIVLDTLSFPSRPLLVWIHGGAFLAGSKEDQSITRMCKEFAKRGYITASINYRLGMIADETAWNCNYPNYSCVFATDSSEWYRALYRGIQDGKGAVRYLINRHLEYRIDTTNVFVAGESAGAFVALGVALLDTPAERLPDTYALPDVPRPSSNSFSCEYNLGKSFPATTIARPDLGGIYGTIEPSTICYNIKAVGNMYGAMSNDLLQLYKSKHQKPAIYSFHQPCDIVVPIDAGRVYWGLSWCFTNGYNCYGIANTPTVFGSRTFNGWNTQNNYGYIIQNEFTATNFPYNFLFGSGSCADQVNNPCHAYDNAVLRENNLAQFFAGFIPIVPECDPTLSASEPRRPASELLVSVFPNPTRNTFKIRLSKPQRYAVRISDAYGRVLLQEQSVTDLEKEIDLGGYTYGLYLVQVRGENGECFSRLVLKTN